MKNKKTKLIIPSILIIVLSLVFVAAVIDYFRSDLSDPWDGTSYNATKWTNTLTCSQTGRQAPKTPPYSSTFGCTGSSKGDTSFTTVLNPVGSGALETSMTSNSYTWSATGTNSFYHNINFKNENITSTGVPVQWDVYITGEGSMSTNTPTAPTGYASANVILGIADGFLGTQFPLYTVSVGSATGSSETIALDTWHLKIEPHIEGGQLTLTNGTGDVLNITILPVHPTNWQNISFYFETTATSSHGAYVRSSAVAWNIYNYSVFETTVPYLLYSNEYSETVYETQHTSINTTITLNPDVYNTLTNLKLIYDDIEYPATISGNTTTRKLMANIGIPIVTSDTTKDFVFNFTLSGPGGTVYVQTDTVTQNVNDTSFEICNGTNGSPYLNITTYELGTFIETNASLILAIQYWLGSGDEFEEVIFNDLEANKSRFNFCFTPGTEPFTADGFMEFYWTNDSGTQFPSSQYYVEDATFSDDTTELALYLITDDSGELVTFKVIDEAFTPVHNAYVRVMVWDTINDNFYTTAIGKTNVLGETTAWIQRQTHWYQYQVIKDGIVYLTTDPLIETQLERELQINLIAQSPYSMLGNVSYTFDYDNTTQIFTYTWADTTGNVAQACLKVGNLGNTSVLNYECLSSASGTLTYDLSSAANGTYVGYAILRNTEDVWAIIDSIMVTKGVPERFSRMGNHALLPAIILIGTLAAIGIASGSVPFAIILTIVGVVASWGLGAVKFNPTIIYSLVAVAIMILIFSRRRTG